MAAAKKTTPAKKPAPFGGKQAPPFGKGKPGGNSTPMTPPAGMPKRGKGKPGC
jgi:hypothetical protein